MKAIALKEAQSRLDKLFEEAQAGSPVLLVRGGEVAKLERVEPAIFGGDLAALGKNLPSAAEVPQEGPIVKSRRVEGRLRGADVSLSREAVASAVRADRDAR
ncbi:MAG: hypothetical protein ACLQVY_13690 [Limisphaerales bacterium]